MTGGGMVQFRRKDLLDMQDLTAEEIQLILDTALPMQEIMRRDIKKLPTLRGKVVLNLFFEPSTRTRTSFELAGKYMGADTINFTAASSSAVKGETLLDTGRTIAAMGVDVVVIRHSAAGAPHMLARALQARVINAGDGMHEHPTQALLDLFTLREVKGRLAGLEVAIIGDILHSRVARSNIWGLTRMGAHVRVAGPATLLPPGLEQLGVRVCRRVEEALEGADAVMLLRLQLERQQQGLLPSLREYARQYALDQHRLAYARPDAVVLHPGPINRGVEINSELADGPASRIERQVTNGVAVRMALLYLLAGGGEVRDQALA